jgi:Trypsin-co-occurring domain 1
LSKLVRISTDHGSVFLETAMSETTGEVVLAGGIEDRVGKKFEDLMKVIYPITDSIVKSVEGLAKKPQSTTVEFGLSITAEGNLFVTKIAGEASLKIGFEWRST